MQYSKTTQKKKKNVNRKNKQYDIEQTEQKF